MHLPSQILVPLITVNFTLGCIPVKSIRLCAEEGAAEQDSEYQSLALDDLCICSDHTGASQRWAKKAGTVATLAWIIKMASVFGAAKYQAYNTYPKAVKLLLWMQKY